MLALPTTALAAPGDLDPTFGGDDTVITDLGANEAANDMEWQPDGKIVAVGSASPGVFALARYNTNGSLDTGFGGGDGDADADGMVTTDFGGTDRANSVAVQDDGRIVAAVGGGAGDDFALARYEGGGGTEPPPPPPPTTVDVLVTLSRRPRSPPKWDPGTAVSSLRRSPHS